MSSKPHFIVNLPTTLLEWCKVIGVVAGFTTPILLALLAVWGSLNAKVSGYTTYVQVAAEQFKSIDQRLKRLEDSADNAHGAKTAASRSFPEAPQ